MRYDVILTNAENIVDCWTEAVDTFKFDSLSREDADALVRLSKSCSHKVVAALLPVEDSEGESDA